MKNGRKSKEFRETIIENAQKVFGKYGLKKTTMDDIAQTVNKAKGALYYYFRSKEDVYEAVLEKETEHFRDEIYKAIEKEKNTLAKFHTYVIIRMKLFQKLANFYSTFQSEYLENYAFIQRIRKKYDEEEMQLILSILKEGKEKEDLVIEDLELASLAVLTALKGFEFAWSIEEDFTVVEKQVDCLLSILFNGLYKR